MKPITNLVENTSYLQVGEFECLSSTSCSALLALRAQIQIGQILSKSVPPVANADRLAFRNTSLAEGMNRPMRLKTNHERNLCRTRGCMEVETIYL